ncbi:MAG: hypothetical protein OXQ94_13820 [Gemmatimonadota bacterium]|nr:hypothetical protein [Gemmatimonadota bacterium]MDE2872753.1 hypothetical protein [Gemmatimonadota bacterium]
MNARHHGPLLAVLLPLLPPPPATAQPPDPTRDAYLDETARHLVAGARSAQGATRQAVRTHTALVRERLAFDAPTGRHDRPWMRGERLLRARWSGSGPGSFDLLEEHFRHPGVGPSTPRYFQGLRAGHLPVDPFADPFTLGLAPFLGAGAAAIAVRSPLGADAGRYYQFRSGDTTTLALEDGRTIRAIPVTAIPRYRSIRFAAAIMWIDPESFGLVRAAYRPAKRIDHEVTGVLREAGGWWLGLNVTAGDTVPSAPAARQPGWFGQLINETFTAVLLGIETDISSVIVDFAPVRPGRWLPRHVQWTGYTGIESVTSTGSVVPTLPFVIDWTLEPATRGAAEASGAEGPVDSGESGTGPPSAHRPWDPARARAGALHLGDTLAGIGTGAAAARGDAGEAASPWYLYPPVWTLNLVRYNPVEGVSIGAQARRDFGWVRSVLTVRAATREWREIPDLDLTLQRDRPGSRMQFSVYRALRTGALGAGGIDGFPLPLILESDSLDFHRSTGAALRFLPGSGERLGFSLGLFAERDREIEDGDERIRVGTELAWKPWWGGLGREAIGAGGTVSVRVAAGDRGHVRTMVEGALLLPLSAGISLGLQGGVADVSGDPLPQDLWDLGATGAWLRGHSEAIPTSRAWMARADLQFPARYARVSLFADRASAEGGEYLAAGAGLVLLDGLLRLDVAQGLTEERDGGPDAVLRFHVLADNLF